jgi:acetyl-CoA C-acetyltransferase
VLEAGIPQQTLFDDAYRSLLAGDAAVALIVGGEAAGRAARARRAGIELDEHLDGDGEPDERRSPSGEIVHELEIKHGMWSPVQQYALIDSSLRACEHRSLDEHRDDIARLWAGFSRVASGFEHAAYRDARSESFIREPSTENRAMSFPYNKWHCSQMNVDQAAAILVTTLERADTAGVDPAHVVFPLVALESSASVAVIRRRDLHRWPAMKVLGETAAAHLGRPLDQIDAVEVYSCFPAAVRVQQRELGLPLDRIPTITGGEAFAGGPWNNFVLQATATMIERLRAQPGTTGMVTTVSGFLHKPGLAIYSTEPGRHSLLVADLAAEAAVATPTLPVVSSYSGPATIAAYTVSAERSGAARVVALLDTPDNERWIAFNEDPAVAERATSVELVGTRVIVDDLHFTLATA